MARALLNGMRVFSGMASDVSWHIRHVTQWLLLVLFAFATNIPALHADRVNPYRFESNTSIFHRPGVSTWVRVGAIFASEGLDRTGPRYSTSLGAGIWIDPRQRIVDAFTVGAGSHLTLIIDGRTVLSGTARRTFTAVLGVSGLAFGQSETDVLFGWQQRSGPLLVSLDAGLVERQDEAAETLTRYGARVQGSVLWSDPASRFAAFDWRWTSIDHAVQVTARAGFPTPFAFKLGPEAGLHTKIGTGRYAVTLGLAATGIDILGYDVSVGGGVSRDDLGRTGAYVSVFASRRFVIWRSTLDWGEVDD